MKINIFESIKKFISNSKQEVEQVDACRTTYQFGDLIRTDDYALKIYNRNKEKLEKLYDVVLDKAKELADYCLVYKDTDLVEIIESTESELKSCEYGSLRWHNLQGKLEGLRVVQNCVLNNEE